MTFRESPDHPTPPTAARNSTWRLGNGTHRLDGGPARPRFITHARRRDWRRETSCVSPSPGTFCSRSRQLPVTVFGGSGRSRAAPGHPAPSPSEGSEMNINMNERADQPAGKKTGSRREKRWIELKKIKERDWGNKAHLESKHQLFKMEENRRRVGDEWREESSCR